MSRIRSIHPGLFTDESFVALSMAARILLPGIWTEADDHGVFEWKPLTLKMKIFPADNVHVPDLLLELEAHEVVKRFVVEGKEYGAVRNFGKYQRPKKPAYRYPLPDDLRTYVHSPAASTPPVENQLPTSGEKHPQMEDGGGKRKEEKENKKDIRAVAKATRPPNSPEFQNFWKSYPRRLGANPKAPASKKFEALVKSGADPTAIIAAASRYSAECREQKIVGTSFVAQAMTWLNQQRFDDYQPPPQQAFQPPPGAQSDSELREKYEREIAESHSRIGQPADDNAEELRRESAPIRQELRGNGVSDDHQGHAGLRRMG